MKKRTFKDSFPAIVKSFVRANVLPQRSAFVGSDLSAVFVADTHTDADPYRDRTDILRRAFAGIRNFGKPDVLCIAGDLTNCGDEKEYALLRRLKRAYLKNITVLPQMGNHDSWHHSDDPNYTLAENLYRSFCRYCGFVTDKNYFYTQIKGYPFIVMGTEALCHDQPEISAEQVTWLNETLYRARKTGKTIFVVNHQPPNGRNGTAPDNIDAGIGTAQSENIDLILLSHAEKYTAPILFFSGHMHKIAPECFEMASDRLYYINLPSLEYGCKGENRGEGVAVTVKDGNVDIKAENFIKKSERSLGTIITEKV